MRGSDENLCFSGKERGKVGEEYLGRIIIVENDWDRNMEGDAVEKSNGLCMLK